MAVAMYEIIRDIILSDKSILSRKEDFIQQLELAIQDSMDEEFSLIRRAVRGSNVGELLLNADSKGKSEREDIKTKALKKLINIGLSEENGKFVIKTLAVSLGWEQAVGLKKDNTGGVMRKNTTASKPISKPLPQNASSDVWICSCGRENRGLFCMACGTKRGSRQDEGTSYVPPVNSAIKTEPVVSMPQAIDVSPTAPIEVMTQETLANASVQNISEPQAPDIRANRYQEEHIVPYTESGDGTDYHGNDEQWRRRRDVFKDEYFITEGRLNRWAYFIKSLKLTLWLILFGSIAVIIGMFILSLGWLAFLVVIALATVAQWMVLIRRLHDLNLSGWWSLLYLVPYVDIIFCLYVLFAKGTDGPNRFGEDPLRYL